MKPSAGSIVLCSAGQEVATLATQYAIAHWMPCQKGRQAGERKKNSVATRSTASYLRLTVAEAVDDARYQQRQRGWSEQLWCRQLYIQPLRCLPEHC